MPTKYRKHKTPKPRNLNPHLSAVLRDDRPARLADIIEVLALDDRQAAIDRMVDETWNRYVAGRLPAQPDGLA